MALRATPTSSGRKPEQSRSISAMPSGPVVTNATCSMTSRDCPSRLSRNRQLRRFRRPTCARCVSTTSKSEARENQPSKRRAISSRPERSSGPRGKSIRACASGARDSANRPKSRAERAERKASGADSCMRPRVAAARSATHQPFGRSSSHRPSRTHPPERIATVCCPGVTPPIPLGSRIL